jgi:uncharacterized protein
MHYLLTYEIAPDYLARRGDFRAVHLAHAWQAVQRGELLLGGAVGEPPDSALLLFQGDSPAAAEAFAKADPYVLNGLVTRWSVKPWNTVVGEAATNPVARP